MTWTSISDMVQPEILMPYVAERIANTNNFIRSGVMAPNEALTAAMRSGGTTGKFPFYKPFDGDDEVLDDGATGELSLNAAETDSEQYAVLARGKAYSASDLSKAFSGSDPMRAVANSLADYWSNAYNGTLLSTAAGLFDAASFSDHVNDISGTGTPDFSSDAVIDTRAVLGDRANGLDVIVMHSKTLAAANKADLVEYLRISQYDPEVPFYLGMRVIVDDRVPYASGTGVTSVYLFGMGSFAYGGNTSPRPLEVDRDSLTGGGLDVLVSRSHHVIHPVGFNLDVSGISGSTPSNTEISDGTVEFTAARELKNIPMAELICTV